PVALQGAAVTPINTCTNKAGPAIPLEEEAIGPSAIAITPDGATAYVVSYDSGTVTPISTRTNKAGRAIPVGAYPEAIAITPNGATAYVVNASSDTVTPISTRTNKAGPAIPVGPDPGVIAIMTGNRLPVPSRTRPRRITTAPPGSGCSWRATLGWSGRGARVEELWHQAMLTWLRDHGAAGPSPAPAPTS
ncbi:MAG TPA: YncE family protein, partial [Trebonia sp.]|nr:YncE family protein [Trebonia sp.]